MSRKKRSKSGKKDNNYFGAGSRVKQKNDA
jgi:hypothetical protein